MTENRSCASYGPGHLVHWIQAKKSCEPGQPVTAVKVVAVHDDGLIELETRDAVLTLWHHNPAGLRTLVGKRAEWRPRFNVLRAGSTINLCDPGDARPCAGPVMQRPAETAAEFVVRSIKENGGFSGSLSVRPQK